MKASNGNPLVFVFLVFLGALLNGIGDYPALFVTRLVLKQAANGGLSLVRAIAIDFVLTVFLVFLVFLLFE